MIDYLLSPHTQFILLGSCQTSSIIAKFYSCCLAKSDHTWSPAHSISTSTVLYFLLNSSGIWMRLCSVHFPAFLSKLVTATGLRSTLSSSFKLRSVDIGSVLCRVISLGCLIGWTVLSRCFIYTFSSGSILAFSWDSYCETSDFASEMDSLSMSLLTDIYN